MSEYLQLMENHRNKKDDFFKKHPDSPLKEEDKQRFIKLKYFPTNKIFCFKNILLEEFPNPKKIYFMRRTRGDEVKYYIFGKVKFLINEKNYDLLVYTNPDVGEDYYFVPFWDETALSGETYGSGRYVELEKNLNGTFNLDFNMAYNPYCVYSDNYSCPLIPKENRLNVRIEAGEMNFK